MSREADLKLLRSVMAPANEAERSAGESQAFGEMLSLMESGERHVLSDKQRRWALEVAARLRPVRAADVPRGREVPTPPVLQNLPKKPPPIPKDVSRSVMRRLAVQHGHCGKTEIGCYAFINGDCACDCCGAG